jgi:hypothetical protein
VSHYLLPLVKQGEQFSKNLFQISRENRSTGTLYRAYCSPKSHFRGAGAIAPLSTKGLAKKLDRLIHTSFNYY